MKRLHVLSSSQRRVLYRLAAVPNRTLPLRDLPAATVRWLEAQGLVKTVHSGVETRVPGTSVPSWTPLPATVRLTERGVDVELEARLGLETDSPVGVRA